MYTTKATAQSLMCVPSLYISTEKNYETLKKAIENKRKEMFQAAKDMDFKQAAKLRDEMFAMENRLQAIES